MVHHDLWDFDGNAAPQLTTIRHNGRNRDIVALAGKTGWLYVFDRVTGEPIWPIEERPVPKSDMPGEETWPTQPFPTNPPPFAKQELTVRRRQSLFTARRVRGAEDESPRREQQGTVYADRFHRHRPHTGRNGGALFGGTAAEPRHRRRLRDYPGQPGHPPLTPSGETAGAAVCPPCPVRPSTSSTVRCAMARIGWERTPAYR